MEMIFSETLNDYVCRADIRMISVVSVVAKPDYTLLLRFSNEETRRYDARPLLEKSVFAPLRNITLFLQAYADGCSVAWSDELDIDPQHLYEDSVLI